MIHVRNTAGRLAVALFLCSPAKAADLLAVLSSDSDHYWQAFNGFTEAWGSSIPYIVAGRDPIPRSDVIVAFGSLAAMESRDAAKLLVACLAPSARHAPSPHELHVAILPSPDKLLERMHKLLPQMKILSVIWSSELQSGDVLEMSRAAPAFGIHVRSERIDPVDALPERLRALHPPDAVWLMPDPILVNARNFEMLAQYCSAKNIPLLAPAEGLADRGATATFSTSFEDSGKFAAATLRSIMNGARGLDVVHPDVITVTANASTSKKFGLTASPGSTIDRLTP